MDTDARQGTHFPPGPDGPSGLSAWADGLTAKQRFALYGFYADILDAVIALGDDQSPLADQVRPLLTQDTMVHFALARLLVEHNEEGQDSST